MLVPLIFFSGGQMIIVSMHWILQLNKSLSSSLLLVFVLFSQTKSGTLEKPFRNTQIFASSYKLDNG